MTGTQLAISIALAALALLLGVFGSAVFAGLETGTYVLNKVRLELRTAAGSRRARRISWALARPTEMLSALLIANNISLNLVTALTVTLLGLAGSDRPSLYATIVVTPLLFVFGEVLPKNLFRITGETLTYQLSATLKGTMWVARCIGLSPLVLALNHLMLWLFPSHRSRNRNPLQPRQKVRAFLAEGHAHGTITGFQSQMAHRVLSLRSTTVAEVMVKLPDVVAVNWDCSHQQFLETLTTHHYSRLPVWRDRPDNVVGVVSIYDILFADQQNPRPSQFTLEPITLPQSLSVAEALLKLQRTHRALGVVVNNAGTAIGIVTIKDLVEEIIGELQAW